MGHLPLYSWWRACPNQLKSNAQSSLPPKSWKRLYILTRNVPHSKITNLQSRTRLLAQLYILLHHLHLLYPPQHGSVILSVANVTPIKVNGKASPTHFHISANGLVRRACTCLIRIHMFLRSLINCKAIKKVNAVPKSQLLLSLVIGQICITSRVIFFSTQIHIN